MPASLVSSSLPRTNARGKSRSAVTVRVVAGFYFEEHRRGWELAKIAGDIS